MSSTSVVYDVIARDRASRTFSNVERSMSRTSRSFAFLGKAAKAAGVGLAAGAAAATATAAASVKMSVNFQAAMTRVQTQAGASAKDVRTLSAEVLKLGTYAQQSPQELADSLYHLKSVGLDNAKAMKALRQASDFAAVGGAHLEDTTNALAGAWRSGIKGAGNFHQAVGTLNAIIGAGNMRMNDLTDAMGTGFLPAAKSFGLSLSQVGSALALMTDEGIPANVAATRLRMTFSLLGAPSGKAADQLKKVGLNASALAVAMRKGGLIGAIGLLRDHIKKTGLNAVQASQLLARAFGGGRSSSAILTMINNFDVLKKKQDQINHSMGKFDAAVKTQRKTAQAQFALLKSSLDVMAIKLGNVLLPAVVAFVRYLNNTVIPDFVKVKDHLVAMIPVAEIKHKIGDAKSALERMAGMVPVAKIEKSMGRIATAISNYFSGVSDYVSIGGNPITSQINVWIQQVDQMDAGKLGKQLGALILRALATLGSLAGRIANQLNHTFSNFFSQIDWVGIGIAVGKQVPSFLAGLVAGLLNFDLMGLLKGLAKHWQDVLFAVLAVAFTPAKFIGKVAELLARIPFAGRLLSWGLLAFKRFSDGAVSAVGRALRAVGKAFLAGFREVFPNVGKRFAEELSILPTRLGVMRIDLVNKGTAMIRALGDAIGRAATWPVQKLGNLAGQLVKVFAKAGGWLLGAGKNLVLGLLRGIDAILPQPVKDLATLATKVPRALAGAARWLLSAGRDIIAGLRSGIASAMSGIGGFLKSHVWSPIVSGVKSLFGIHSPSTVFHGFGVQMIRGLIRGLVKSNPAAFVRKIFGGVSGEAQKALGWLSDKGMVPLRAIAGAGGAALKAIGGLVGKLTGGGGSGVSRWNGVILAALRMLGQPASLLGAVQHRMMQESGGNPRAINNWDINAQRGDPSRGLMQTIGSTFNAYAGALRGRGIYDPLANVYAGLNYAKHRYGSIYAAMMKAGGYARGTNWATPGWHRVGENGAEWVNFRGGERVLPHGRQPAVASRQTVINNNFNGPITTVDEKSLARKIEQRQRDAFALIGP